MVDDAIKERLKQAETELITASTAFREMKDRVKRGEETDENLWPLMDIRKLAYERWRAIADPLVVQGVPLSAEVLKILNDHRR